MRAVVVLAVALTADAAWCQTLAPEPWQFGAFVDLAHLNSLNSPANHLFRTRGTTPRVDEINLNMAGIYARKQASDASRWGFEITGQGGEDSELFGFSATAPNIRGARWLRRLGPTNVTRLVSVGRGLLLQGGILSSLIGSDSLYAKDNAAYTRPWTADFTPYLMLGATVSYPVSDRVSAAVFLINGYWHLAHANNVPSIGGQIAFRPNARATLKQTVLYGPHQPDTALGLWRVLSDTIVERKAGRLTTAGELQISTERVAGTGGRALWLAAQAPVRWAMTDRWTIAFRPEVAWDRDGRWTTVPQLVKAMTTTLELRTARQFADAMVRLEHRYDRSTGEGAGFFKSAPSGAPVTLTPDQHLVIAALIVSVRSASRSGTSTTP